MWYFGMSLNSILVFTFVGGSRHVNFKPKRMLKMIKNISNTEPYVAFK